MSIANLPASVWKVSAWLGPAKDHQDQAYLVVVPRVRISTPWLLRLRSRHDENSSAWSSTLTETLCINEHHCNPGFRLGNWLTSCSAPRVLASSTFTLAEW